MLKEKVIKKDKKEMTYKIKIEVKFRSGHRLLPPYKGKCNNVHGEGYTAIIEFENKILNNDGMVFDFGDIKRTVKQWIDENWDHAYIHNVDDYVGRFLKEQGMRTYVMGGNPTAENMARYLFYVLKDGFELPVTKVGIVESFQDSIAYYEEDEE